MSSVSRRTTGVQSWWFVSSLCLLLTGVAWAADPAPGENAKTEGEMKNYSQPIPGTGVKFDLIAIKGGEFLIGSPPDEKDREEDEGPQRKVKISPFWMGKCEVTWDEYEQWAYGLDIKRRTLQERQPTDEDKLADAVTRPTKPYTDMSFGMGHDSFPAICMTQMAAKRYCDWLSAKTGHYYRLPTEAEWEYACRAGTTTRYSFGDDPADLDDYAWYFENSDGKYQKVGKKKPNPWGLHDMHGNVMEWTLDQYFPDTYSRFPADGVAVNPAFPPTKLYPHAVRGGSWEDDPEELRTANRTASDPLWKVQDPQLPKSRWYFTDALFLGFRVVRPLEEPSAEEKIRLNGTSDEILDRGARQ